jgi:hypothetical protein
MLRSQSPMNAVCRAVIATLEDFLIAQATNHLLISSAIANSKFTHVLRSRSGAAKPCIEADQNHETHRLFQRPVKLQLRACDLDRQDKATTPR